MSSFKTFALTLAVSIMLTGCFDLESYCNSSLECSRDEVCIDNFCETVKNKNKRCQDVTDYPSGYICKKGRCK